MGLDRPRRKLSFLSQENRVIILKKIINLSRVDHMTAEGEGGEDGQGEWDVGGGGAGWGVGVEGGSGRERSS